MSTYTHCINMHMCVNLIITHWKMNTLSAFDAQETQQYNKGIRLLIAYVLVSNALKQISVSSIWVFGKNKLTLTFVV